MTTSARKSRNLTQRIASIVPHAPLGVRNLLRMCSWTTKGRYTSALGGAPERFWDYTAGPERLKLGS